MEEKRKDSEPMETAEIEEKEEQQEEIQDPGEQLRKLCRGTLKLLHPFRSHGQDVDEIKFDFCALTGTEMMDALDSVNVNNMFAVSNAQALALFAMAAEKSAPVADDDKIKTRLYDAKDIKTRMGAADSVKAIQLAKLFYHASGQAGNNNISKF